MEDCLAASESGAKKQRYEKTLRALVTALFQANLVSDGVVVDAGANTGEESCMYANFGRRVHAVDPLFANVQHIKRVYGRLKLLQPMLGALGERPGEMQFWARKPLHRVAGKQIENLFDADNNLGTPGVGRPQNFSVFALDGLFAPRGLWSGERLAFAHLDMEGSELAAIRGGLKTIARDLPILSTEARLGERAKSTRELYTLVCAASRLEPYPVWL